MFQSMVPSAWLAQWPLQPEERLYAVLGSASEARPLNAWQTAGTEEIAAFDMGRYGLCEWVDVMPYVGIVEPGSAFLDWVASAEATDWGWLAVSSSPPETVAAHLQGLTKCVCRMSRRCFCVFGMALSGCPILQKLGDEAARVLPVFQHYLINGQSLAVSNRPGHGRQGQSMVASAGVAA